MDTTIELLRNETATSGESLVHRMRLSSVDLLRGLVMVIMALDHVRIFFSNAYSIYPTDLTQTNAPLFFTRWITHFCAPVFVFLAGTGAFLSASRGKTKKDLALFLASRGLWLILLNLFVVHTCGWWFNVDYHLLYGDVLWALGWSMMAMAGLVFLPAWSIAAIGIALVTFHNTFDGMRVNSSIAFHWLWSVLHSGDTLEPIAGVHFIPGYPLAPWIGVMAAGYAFGKVLLEPEEKRRRKLLALGTGLTLAFVIIRATNLYGDPHAWSLQKAGVFTVMSFINCEKYPPSLLYLLMTLGPAITALYFFERIPNLAGRPLVTLGRVPLFYYLPHLPLIHLLAVGFAFERYGQASWMFENPSLPVDRLLPFPEGYGYGLTVVYAIWIGVLLLLYPACRRFAEVKRRCRDWWLSYL